MLSSAARLRSGRWAGRGRNAATIFFFFFFSLAKGGFASNLQTPRSTRLQALAARNKANSSRGRSFGKTRARSPRPRRERSPGSSRSPSPAKRTWRSERPFFRTSFRSNDESGSLVCFHCGRHGHFKRSCPHRRGQLGDADGFRPPRQAGSEERPVV